MTPEERAEIASRAKQAAAQMPPLTDEQCEQVALLLGLVRSLDAVAVG